MIHVERSSPQSASLKSNGNNTYTALSSTNGFVGMFKTLPPIGMHKSLTVSRRFHRQTGQPGQVNLQDSHRIPDAVVSPCGPCIS